MTLSDFLAIGGFVVALMVAIAGGIWRVIASEKGIRHELDQEIKKIQKAALDDRDQHMRDMTELGHRFGETITAIRQKLTDVEIYGRDAYVRREDFNSFCQTLRDDIKNLSEKIEARFIRMEGQMNEDRRNAVSG